MADNEFSLIQALGREPAQTQRQLSQNTGLSLGMTNILLRRLARKGYIKIQHLDWKRTHYLLTVQGIAEKTRKSCAYALHAYHQARLIRRRIQEVVQREYAQGMRTAMVVAWPDTAEMIREALQETAFESLQVEYTDAFKHVAETPGTIFTATVEPTPSPKPGQRFIPLLEYEALKFEFSGAPNA
ncbi:MAG: winged helix-turn-helix transcriptional regulator [Elusimicrobiota bacterium]|jgi:DNA-binding MarR family transcriptional regulator